MFYRDEYQDLYDRIVVGDRAGALEVLDELNEMSREDKVAKIRSFLRVLLIHLIKRAADKGQSTRSWDNSIENAVEEITDANKRGRSGGWYLGDEELATALEQVWNRALRNAALEVHRGAHTTEELAALVDRGAILAAALELINKH